MKHTQEAAYASLPAWFFFFFFFFCRKYTCWLLISGVYCYHHFSHWVWPYSLALTTWSETYERFFPSKTAAFLKPMLSHHISVVHDPQIACVPSNWERNQAAPPGYLSLSNGYLCFLHPAMFYSLPEPSMDAICGVWWALNYQNL